MDEESMVWFRAPSEAFSLIGMRLSSPQTPSRNPTVKEAQMNDRVRKLVSLTVKVQPPKDSLAYFILALDQDISAEEAKNVQSAMGYPPSSLGFSGFHSKTIGKHQTHYWSCLKDSTQRFGNATNV
jgi:hypothetical protein